MATYTKTFPVQLHTTDTGLSLKTKRFDTDGVEVEGFTVAGVGFAEIGNGGYTYTRTLDDTFRGHIRYYNAAGTYMEAFDVVNPEDVRPLGGGGIVL